MIRFCLFVACIAAALVARPPVEAHAQSPMARVLFAPYTGEWTGEFRIYTLDGALQTTIQVRQRYFWDGDTQKVVITDRYPDGRVERSHALNYLDGDTPVCLVRKADGTVVRLIGQKQAGRLFWKHDAPKQQKYEIFKEYVDTIGGVSLYFIDGLGMYGSGAHRTILIFEGRYRKVKR
ncbi:MAG: hypothetical protein Q9P90_14260 [candidate division KSB1 bacterium]|nr:hypothetical protein [candidate division KSB1 bacterium]